MSLVITTLQVCGILFAVILVILILIASFLLGAYLGAKKLFSLARPRHIRVHAFDDAVESLQEPMAILPVVIDSSDELYFEMISSMRNFKRTATALDRDAHILQFPQGAHRESQ